MTDRIHREFDRFTDFISNVDVSDLKAYKELFFQKIDGIAKLLEKSSNRKELEDEFFRRCAIIDSSLMHQRTRHKPLGYAGDYQLIDWIYTGKTADNGKGRLFDLMYHTYEASEAVRNRKTYFVKKCLELAHEKKDRFDVLDMGCGSCRDVLEVFETTTNGKNMHFHCVDHEPEAIRHAQTLLAHTAVKDNVRLDTANIFHLKTDHQYDLIWSSGLFDYLDDRVAALLLKKVWRNLKVGGRIIFGNFSPKNPTRNGMELVGKWYLIHRTAEELIALCRRARIPFRGIDVESENLGINLFCIILK